MIYIISHENREQAKKNWAAFRADPVWQAAQKASEANGKLVAKADAEFMDPTDYSKLK
ncbi:MAG: NIPSNAP family protein [Bryobacteraceae bacterium]